MRQLVASFLTFNLPEIAQCGARESLVLTGLNGGKDDDKLKRIGHSLSPRSNISFGAYAIFLKELLAKCRMIYPIFASAHGNAPADFGLAFASSSFRGRLNNIRGIEIETNLCTWDYCDPHDQQRVS